MQVGVTTVQQAAQLTAEVAAAAAAVRPRSAGTGASSVEIVESHGLYSGCAIRLHNEVARSRVDPTAD